MFHLELRNLISEYKSASDYSRPKIKENIANLVNQHESEYQRLVTEGMLDDNSIEIIQECMKKETGPNEDIQFIKRKFAEWVGNYRSNNSVPNNDCRIIIANLISTYAPNRFEVLDKILKINDSQEYEEFKTMLMNFLQAYYAEKIMEYYESNMFKEKGFFQKRKKRNQLLKLTDEIGKYQFNPQKIKEVLS